MPSSYEPQELSGSGAGWVDAAAEADLTFETDLRTAWAARGFELAYQPQFNLLDNRVIAFEALLRWPDAKRGNVPPVTFIPILEAAGLIDEVGQWVLETACREAAKWPDDIVIAVNLSAIQLQNKKLAAIVAAALRDSGLCAARLELEITESSVMPADPERLAALHMIRNTGVRIAIDDFDVGYSALGYLVSFPFDKIKVDQFFTTKLAKADHRHGTAQAIFRALIGLCKDMGMSLLAEGVETREQLMALRDMHCTEIQGFLCGRPQPAAAIPHILAKAPGLLREISGSGLTEAVSAHALWSENVPFAQIAEMLNDIVIVTTADLQPPGPTIVYVNPAFTRLTGYSATEAIGQSPRFLQGPGTSRDTLNKIGADLEAGRPVHEKILNYGKSGAPYWRDLQIVALRDAGGTITHFAGIERDVTMHKRRLDELEYLADRDTLTGIPNRQAFLRATNSEIEAAIQAPNAAAQGKGPCLIFLDVDHFKKINDEFGHPVGDAVLCGIADCLAENVRRVDILGRVGGEEFAVCLPAVTLQEAKALGDRLRGALAGAELATPAGPLKITVSAGVACFAPGETLDALAARADAAMYVAKRNGGNRVRAAETPAQISKIPGSKAKASSPSNAT